MFEKYKITIKCKNLYREIPANEDSKVIRIGTFGKCVIRFDSSQFFENFYAEVVNNNGKWLLNCSENVYISPDGIMKLSVKELNHGDKILLKYQSSNQEILSIGFLIDFDSENKSYDSMVDISNISELKIGGTGECELKLSDTLMGGDIVSITKRDDKYYIKDNNTKYGVYIRGIEIPKHIEEYLNNLKKKDDFIVGDLKSFTEADVSVMSKETGVEFAKITVGEKTYLVRGNSGGTSIPNSILDEMAKNGGTLDFHTHPYNDDLIPSPADRQVLAKLEEMTGQCESKIVTPDNQVALFDKNGAKSITNVEHTIDDEYAKALEALFGGD